MHFYIYLFLRTIGYFLFKLSLSELQRCDSVYSIITIWPKWKSREADKMNWTFTMRSVAGRCKEPPINQFHGTRSYLNPGSCIPDIEPNFGRAKTINFVMVIPTWKMSSKLDSLYSFFTFSVELLLAHAIGYIPQYRMDVNDFKSASLIVSRELNLTGDLSAKGSKIMNICGIWMFSRCKRNTVN